MLDPNSINSKSLGTDMHNLARSLWSFNRSLTGDGNRQTLNLIKSHIPELTIREVPSGTEVFDWIVPQEWSVKEAYIITPQGEKICDFNENNLHLVGYSKNVTLDCSLEQLEGHLFSIPEQPDAIPYITSYYEHRWGFCIKHRDRQKLKKGTYRVIVNSNHFDGHLTYGELLIPGKTEKEIFLSTYICHPSMANNELSGPVVTAFLAKWALRRGENKYSYRIVFVPETIGAITYLSENISLMKKNIIAGFQITCVGDNRSYSFLPSRLGTTLSDHVARHTLHHIDPEFQSYSWLQRGSDERQYCSPNVNLPIASIMRTKYGEYPEYHTSLDDLDTVVSADGLYGGFNALQKAIEIIEQNCYPKTTFACEPNLGSRGLYPTLSTLEATDQRVEARNYINILSLSDGEKSLLEIADILQKPFWELCPKAQTLNKHGLLDLCD